MCEDIGTLELLFHHVGVLTSLVGIVVLKQSPGEEDGRDCYGKNSPEIR